MWSAIVLIVLIGVISEMYRERLKTMSGSKERREEIDSLSQRVTRIEERMANLETLIIEQEKERPYEALSRRG